MRKLLILGAAVFTAAPALAQPADYDDEPVYQAPAEDADMRDRDPRYRDRDEQELSDGPPLPHPGQVQAMTGVMERLLGAVMDLPIGGIAAAVDPYGRSRYHPNATVRDMATRDDPHAEARMRAGIHGATRGIGAMTGALARMMPILQRSIAEVGREVEAAMDQADLGPRRRD